MNSKGPLRQPFFFGGEFSPFGEMFFQTDYFLSNISLFQQESFKGIG
jgi:hypothetical protein